MCDGGVITYAGPATPIGDADEGQQSSGAPTFLRPAAPDAAWTVRLHHNPLVPWIWLGGGIVCLGAIVSMFPTRRRSPAWSTG